MITCNKALVFRCNESSGSGPELLRQVLLERGWQEYDSDGSANGDDESTREPDWNLWWRTSRFRMSEYNEIMPWQRLNHYPKTTAITKKDCLLRHMRRMKGVFGTLYNFIPVSFNLPNDYTKFVAEYTKQRDKSIWICKPADLSRGRGIFIFKDLNDLAYDCNAVVQKYVDDPLLICGYKFDLRMYVCVPSFHPLTLYLYEEGLVRFGTEKYNLNNLENVYSHLTNTSINKFSPTYAVDKERIGPGCKWSLAQLKSYLHQMNIDDSLLWPRVISICTLTILAQVPSVPRISNCFELFGFDILVDEHMKPWLLEVNFSPSLGSDCQADIQVKKPLLHDLLDLLNYKDTDAEHGQGHLYNKENRQKYNIGLGSSSMTVNPDPCACHLRGPTDKTSQRRLPSLCASLRTGLPVDSDSEWDDEGEDPDVSVGASGFGAAASTSGAGSRIRSPLKAARGGRASAGSKGRRSGVQASRFFANLRNLKSSSNDSCWSTAAAAAAGGERTEDDDEKKPLALHRDLLLRCTGHRRSIASDKSDKRASLPSTSESSSSSGIGLTTSSTGGATDQEKENRTRRTNKRPVAKSKSLHGETTGTLLAKNISAITDSTNTASTHLAASAAAAAAAAAARRPIAVAAVSKTKTTKNVNQKHSSTTTMMTTKTTTLSSASSKQRWNSKPLADGATSSPSHDWRTASIKRIAELPSTTSSTISSVSHRGTHRRLHHAHHHDHHHRHHIHSCAAAVRGAALRHGVGDCDLDQGALPLKDYLRRSQMMATLGAAAAAKHAAESGGVGGAAAFSSSHATAAPSNAHNYLCRGGPLKQVGGFFLTFPFNEATRRSCFPSLDIRGVVAEIKKELRKCVADVRLGRQSSAFNRDIPLLWGPPKAVGAAAAVEGGRRQGGGGKAEGSRGEG